MTEIEFPVAYVRDEGLPGVCAHTGEPTTRSYGQTLYSSRWWNNWVFVVLDLFPGLILRAFLADGVKVGIPINRRMSNLRRLTGWPSAAVGLFGAWSLLWAVAEPVWNTIAALSFALLAVMVVTYARTRVWVRRRGDTVRMRVHPALAEAIRADLALTAPPRPSWHPDPSGAPQYRWWDGTRWTDHVKAYADA